MVPGSLAIERIAPNRPDADNEFDHPRGGPEVTMEAPAPPAAWSSGSEVTLPLHSLTVLRWMVTAP